MKQRAFYWKNRCTEAQVLDGNNHISIGFSCNVQNYVGPAIGQIL